MLCKKGESYCINPQLLNKCKDVWVFDVALCFETLYEQGANHVNIDLKNMKNVGPFLGDFQAATTTTTTTTTTTSWVPDGPSQSEEVSTI